MIIKTNLTSSFPQPCKMVRFKGGVLIMWFLLGRNNLAVSISLQILNLFEFRSFLLLDWSPFQD